MLLDYFSVQSVPTQEINYKLPITLVLVVPKLLLPVLTVGQTWRYLTSLPTAIFLMKYWKCKGVYICLVMQYFITNRVSVAR